MTIRNKKKWGSKNHNNLQFMKGKVLIALTFLPSILWGQPNVLLIFSDDLNTQIGPYMGVDKHTPNLDKLAKHGVTFTRAYCQYPLSGPSRASIMSGLYPVTNGVMDNDDTPGSYKKDTPALKEHPSMAGFFRERGYFTARVSKIFHMGVPGGIERGEPGGDEPDSWDYAYNVMGPETNSPAGLELLSPKLKHFGSGFSRMILPDSLQYFQTDYLAASQAIAILESRAGNVPEGALNKTKIKPDAPFFIAVGFVRPHVPLISIESYYKQYPLDKTYLPEVIIADNIPEEALNMQNEKRFGMNEEQKKKVISSYMASVRFMDDQVGRLLYELERLDLKKNTIVIFLSDHGYNLGEHDSWSKSVLWEGTVRVPLIISVPGHEKTYGTECKSIIQLIDLYPTLVDLCGFEAQTPEILQGKSLTKFIINSNLVDTSAQAFSITNQGKAGTITYGNYRYTRWGEQINIGKEELYCHDSDPEEHENLITNNDYLNVIEQMRMLFKEVSEKANKNLNQ